MNDELKKELKLYQDELDSRIKESNCNTKKLEKVKIDLDVENVKLLERIKILKRRIEEIEEELSFPEKIKMKEVMNQINGILSENGYYLKVGYDSTHDSDWNFIDLTNSKDNSHRISDIEYEK